MITSPRPVALFELGRQGKSCQTFRLHTVRMSSIGLARGTIFSFLFFDFRRLPGHTTAVFFDSRCPPRPRGAREYGVMVNVTSVLSIF